MGLAAVIAAALLVATSVSDQGGQADRQAVEALKRHAAVIAGSAHLLSPDAMQAYTVRTSTTLGARLTLIAPDGALLADSAISAADIGRADNHLMRPEIQAARLRGSGASNRLSTTTQVRYWYVAQRVDSPAAVGFVRLGVPTTYLARPPWYAGWPVLSVAVLAMLVLIVIAANVMRRQSLRLDDLSSTLEEASRLPAGDTAPGGALGPLERLSTALRRNQTATSKRIAELEAQGDILTSVIASMKEGLLVVGDDHRIQLTNRAMRELLGLPFDPTGRLVAEVVRHPSVLRDLEIALVEGREIRQSIINLESSGRSFELQISQMRAGKPTAPRLLVLFFDVTRLQALDAVRREFVGNVSHELRTPLTSINAFVETLLEGSLDDPEATRRFLAIVRKHGQRMNALLDDLTDLSAIETGAIRLQLRALDARSAVREVIEQLRPLAGAREVELEVDLPVALPLTADRQRLEQVLTNLVHNAIKFNRPHGSVTIRGEREGDKVRLSVQDTGAGIPADSHDKIFNRFYQLDKARSREHGGTGLGLAIVKHLMRLHGGTVRVESALGQGSTFWLEFPAGDETSAVA